MARKCEIRNQTVWNEFKYMTLLTVFRLAEYDVSVYGYYYQGIH